jgi:hypothetical protein
MNGIRAASRSAPLLVAALCALAMAAGPAWASALVGPVQPEPAWVYPAQCHQNGGSVVRDRYNPNLWHCVGGKNNGQDVRIQS